VTQVIGQPDPSAFSGRLRQRLTELGAAVVSIGPDGARGLLGPHRWEHGLIVGAPVFAAALRTHRDELFGHAGRRVNLWPGLTLIPMHDTHTREHAGNHPDTSPSIAAMLLGIEILASEQLARLCDSREVDFQAAVARFDTAALMSEKETDRLAQVIAWMARDAADLGWRLHELHDLSWELAGSYEELSLLYKLSTSMVVDHPPQAFMEQACAEMREVVGLRWLAIQLSPTEPGFEDLSVPVCVDSQSSYDLAGIRKIGTQLIEAMDGRTDPVILDDARVLGIPGLEKFAHSLLVTPCTSTANPWGCSTAPTRSTPGPA